MLANSGEMLETPVKTFFGRGAVLCIMASALVNEWLARFFQLE